MIQPGSFLNITDNSGAQKLMCIRVLRKNQNQSATVADIIIGVIKKAISTTDLKKSDVVRAVIVRTCENIKRTDGSTIAFQDNAAVLINNENNPRATRIFGPVARELRERNFIKVISLAFDVV